jgi:hypothetical protein
VFLFQRIIIRWSLPVDNRRRIVYNACMDLETVIREHIIVGNGAGWQKVQCKVCDDHGRKGKRGGFLFETDRVAYSCFNCGHKAVFDGRSNKRLSKPMVDLLVAIGVTDQEIQNFNMSLVGNKTVVVKDAFKFPEPTDMPDVFYPIGDDPMSEIALDYIDNRKLPQYDYYLCEKTTNPAFKFWYKRLIIPIYFRDDLIGWQGRTLFDAKRKYMSKFTTSGGTIFNADEIHKYEDKPLFITEGIFDAMLLGGIAVFSNAMTTKQIKWINMSPREKVVVPDKDKASFNLITAAVNNNWSVSTPDIGSCKDINDAVVKYGRLYTLNQVYNSISSGNQALTKGKIYCE